jgi:glycosyltransferase involved in cell wall biosynthesis
MISILQPVYNAAPFLPECLDSILAQTEENWELLAIDDFSTDESWNILQAYAAKDKRIKVFQNTEKGIISALRLAFSESSGNLITRMDADDRMPPEKLNLFQKTLLKQGTGYVATGLVEYFSESELGDGYRRYANWLNKLALEGRWLDEIYRECVIPSPCWMLHRKDLIACGAFDPNLYPEDYDLVFRFFKENLQPVCVPFILHHWRDHSSRASRNDPHYDDNHFFELKIKYFLELEHQPDRPLVLWGAGKKGKKLAKLLLEREINFLWVCDNTQKWGLDIYGQKMQSYKIVPKLANPQLILAVSAPDGQRQIQDQLKKWSLQPKIHYFWFC